MKLQEGQLIKLIVRDYHHRAKQQVGKVEKIYRTYILLQLKNYKMCITKADVIDPNQYRLKIKKHKKWVNVTKEMIQEGVIS